MFEDTVREYVSSRSEVTVMEIAEKALLHTGPLTVPFMRQIGLALRVCGWYAVRVNSGGRIKRVWREMPK
jgi:hypothetical protein